MCDNVQIRNTQCRRTTYNRIINQFCKESNFTSKESQVKDSFRHFQLLSRFDAHMKTDISLLEHLPNEILIQLFQYFESQELLQGFYSLNSRLNYLIQTAAHLRYSTNQNDGCISTYPYVHTLRINSYIDKKLDCFSNLRRLILDYMTENLLSLLNGNMIPNLEHISISHKVHPFYMFDLRRIIFSNIVPSLQSCYISRVKPPSVPLEWTQTLSLRLVTVNDIDAITYSSILAACPNLSFLEFKLAIRSTLESETIVHKNLKHLIINVNYDEWPWEDNIFKNYLLCVPQLQQLKVYRSISIDSTKMNYFQCYDWFCSIIIKHLFVLDRFRFNLCVSRSNRVSESSFQDICINLKRNFNKVYQGRFKSRLLVW